MDKPYKGDHLKGEIEILEAVEVFQNEYVEIYNDRVIFPSGNPGHYIRIISSEPNSVAILPLIDRNTAVLVKNFRHGARGWGYEVPKGGIRKGETPEDAAFRELQEETGYTAARLIDLGDYRDSPAILSETMKLFIAVGCTKYAEPNYEKTEAISDICSFEIGNFLKLPDKLDYQDAVTELMILKYLQLGGIT